MMQFPQWLTRKNVFRGYATLQTCFFAVLGMGSMFLSGKTSSSDGPDITLFLECLILLLISLGMVLLFRWAAVFMSIVALIGSFFGFAFFHRCLKLDVHFDLTLIFVASLLLLIPVGLTLISWKELK